MPQHKQAATQQAPAPDVHNTPIKPRINEARAEAAVSAASYNNDYACHALRTTTSTHSPYNPHTILRPSANLPHHRYQETMDSGDEGSGSGSSSTTSSPPYYPEPPRVPIESLRLVRTAPAAREPPRIPRNPAVVYRDNNGGAMPPSAYNNPYSGLPPYNQYYYPQQHPHQPYQPQPLWRQNTQRRAPPTNWQWGTPQQR